MVVPQDEEWYELQDDRVLEHNDSDEQKEGTANGLDLGLELLLDLQTDYSQADFGTEL